MAAAAIHSEQLEDLSNAAIEELIRRSYGLPGFTTLLKEARQQRTQTYAHLYQQVSDALTPSMAAQLDQLLVIDPTIQRSRWDRMKDPTGKATLTNLKRLADHLAWLSDYQPIFQAIS